MQLRAEYSGSGKNMIYDTITKWYLPNFSQMVKFNIHIVPIMHTLYVDQVDLRLEQHCKSYYVEVIMNYYYG
jgi:hypothetical protein